jgi:hypothetical protein
MSSERKAKVNNFLGYILGFTFSCYKSSPLTEKERSISTMSSILAHKHMHKHPVSASYFKILSSGTSEWDLLIRESLLISQLNPVLNANIRSTPLELF